MRITAAALTPAQAWRLEHFGTVLASGEAADDADPDGDAVPNLLERAFGGDTLAERDLLPALDRDAPVLSLRYRRAADASDLGYAVQENTDLVSTSWMPATGSAQVIAEEAGGVQLVRFTRPLEAGDSRLFLRLEVTQL